MRIPQQAVGDRVPSIVHVGQEPCVPDYLDLSKPSRVREVSTYSLEKTIAQKFNYFVIVDTGRDYPESLLTLTIKISG